MGGAAGHMNHPFDIDWVNTGEDLIDFFLDAAEYLQEKPGSIKWDGVNTSFKLITDENGRKDFRVDRGDQTPMSVVGMTAEQAYTRWETGHGMPVAIEKLLAIFNEALPNIEPELKALGMWDDSTKLFNTEYIGRGGSNVIQYGKNILAIHGINQFYEKKAQPHRIRKGIGMDRPGLERPLGPETGKPVGGKSVEIDYDRSALESLIQKVRPIAAKYDFSILGDTPTEVGAPIDYESVLDTNFLIKISGDNVENFSIREWLRDAVNPRDTRIMTKEGKDIGALSKQVYIAALNGVSFVDWLSDQKDVEVAINGVVFYHATKELGNAVKRSLRVSEDVSGMLGWESKFDSAANHEGVILRDPKFGSKPVKITGEFILEGLASTHGDASKQDLAQETQPADIQIEKTKLALLAGGFKPPHKGHLEMVKFYNQQVGPDGKVIILLGSGGKEPRTINGRTITSQDSMEIWDVYLKNEPSIPWPSSKIEFQNVEGAGPIAPIIDYVRDQAPEDQIILLGAGEKDEDRWPNIMADPRNNPRGLEIETTPAPNIVDDNGNPLSARIMREAVEGGDFETFKSYIPDSSMQFAEKMFTTLGGGTVEEPQEEPQEQLQEDNPLPLGIFLGLVEEGLDKKRLNEQGGMFGIPNFWDVIKNTPDFLYRHGREILNPLETIAKAISGAEPHRVEQGTDKLVDIITSPLDPLINPIVDYFSGRRDIDAPEGPAGSTPVVVPPFDPIKHKASQPIQQLYPGEIIYKEHKINLSSEQFLELVEQALYEDIDPGSFHAISHQANKTLSPLDALTWNDQAAEDAIYDNDDHEGRIKHVAEGEDEELEEMSSMAGGNVEGSSGGAWGKDFTSENEEEAIKSHTLEEEELVENIVNYLNNGVGVL